jgi:hypothetical protein
LVGVGSSRGKEAATTNGQRKRQLKDSGRDRCQKEIYEEEWKSRK